MSTETQQCSKCGETKPLTEFVKDRRSTTGYRSYCQSCDRKAHQALASIRRAEHDFVIPTEKRCRHCHEIKPASAFYGNRTTTDGLQSWCRVCTRTHERERAHQAPTPINQEQPVMITMITDPHAEEQDYLAALPYTDDPQPETATDRLGAESVVEMLNNLDTANRYLLQAMTEKERDQQTIDEFKQTIDEVQASLATVREVAQTAIKQADSYRHDAEQWREFRKHRDARQTQMKNDELSGTLAKVRRVFSFGLKDQEVSAHAVHDEEHASL